MTQRIPVEVTLDP